MSKFKSQRKYVKDIMSKFSTFNGRLAATPMNINERLQHKDEAEITVVRRFRSLVDELIYLTHTRPDIRFHVGIIYKFMQHP